MAKKKKRDFDEVIARHIARFVRNTTNFESLHKGIYPSSKAGDYSDVKVVTPFGEIEWTKVSRFTNKEMRPLMLEIEKQIFHALKTYQVWKNKYEKEIKELNGIEFEEYFENMMFNTPSTSWDLPNQNKE